MTPSELCSDEVFVRRLYLDITGLLPTVEESAAFLRTHQQIKDQS